MLAFLKPNIDEPGKIKTKAHENYQKLIQLLSELQSQGKLRFEYDSITEPFETHVINIWWKTSSDVFESMEVDAVTLREIFSLINDGLLIEKSEGNYWQLTTKIFYE